MNKSSWTRLISMKRVGLFHWFPFQWQREIDSLMMWHSEWSWRWLGMISSDVRRFIVRPSITCYKIHKHSGQRWGWAIKGEAYRLPPEAAPSPQSSRGRSSPIATAAPIILEWREIARDWWLGGVACSLCRSANQTPGEGNLTKMWRINEMGGLQMRISADKARFICCYETYTIFLAN